MTYNCLFTVLTDVETVNETLAHAVATAKAHDAHLDAFCLGVDRTQTGYYYAGASAIVLQETITLANEEARAIEVKAQTFLKNADLRWDTETGMAHMADLGRHIAGRSRFSDLIVLPKPYGAGKGAELETITEAALFEGNTPAVILPDGAMPEPQPKRILLAWNESAEALSAIRAALPLLTKAESAHVAVIDPPTHGPARSDPGGLLSQYLARHGVKVDIGVLSKTLPRVSDVLLRHATDINADMIVMGAYGHSRFRESIFGGATRNMLEQTTLPVLMAH